MAPLSPLIDTYLVPERTAPGRIIGHRPWTPKFGPPRMSRTYCNMLNEPFMQLRHVHISVVSHAKEHASSRHEHRLHTSRRQPQSSTAAAQRERRHGVLRAARPRAHPARASHVHRACR
eukprot:5847599-Prymnesium_polylepis.1